MTKKVNIGDSMQHFVILAVFYFD